MAKTCKVSDTKAIRNGVALIRDHTGSIFDASGQWLRELHGSEKKRRRKSMELSSD